MDITMQGQMQKRAFEKAYENIKYKYNLTTNEIIILLYLNSNIEKNTAKDIVEETMVVKSHVSKSVDSLVNKKLLTRVPDIENKKIIHLELEKKAKRIITDLEKTEDNLKSIMLKGIPENHIKILEESFQKIRENIKEIVNS